MLRSIAPTQFVASETFPLKFPLDNKSRLKALSKDVNGAVSTPICGNFNVGELDMRGVLRAIYPDDGAEIRVQIESVEVIVPVCGPKPAARDHDRAVGWISIGLTRHICRSQKFCVVCRVA